MRRHKYEGLEHFAQKLLFKRRICDSVKISVKTIEPHLEGQQGNPRDIIRRAFDGYIIRYLTSLGSQLKVGK